MVLILQLFSPSYFLCGEPVYDEVSEIFYSYNYNIYKRTRKNRKRTFGDRINRKKGSVRQISYNFNFEFQLQWYIMCS